MCITAAVVAHGAVLIPGAAPAAATQPGAGVPAGVGRLGTGRAAPGGPANAAEAGLRSLQPAGAAVSTGLPGQTDIRLHTAGPGGRLCPVAGSLLAVTGVAGPGARVPRAAERAADRGGRVTRTGVGRPAAAGPAPGRRTAAAEPATRRRRAETAVAAVVPNGAHVPQHTAPVGGWNRRE